MQCMLCGITEHYAKSNSTFKVKSCWQHKTWIIWADRLSRDICSLISLLMTYNRRTGDIGRSAQDLSITLQEV